MMKILRPYAKRSKAAGDLYFSPDSEQTVIDLRSFGGHPSFDAAFLGALLFFGMRTLLPKRRAAI